MTRPGRASEDEIDDWLSINTSWERTGEAIARTIECRSFPAAIALVDAVAVQAEAADHHPDIDIRWRRVTFTLSTHSESGLTALDFALAEQIDTLAEQPLS